MPARATCSGARPRIERREALHELGDVVDGLAAQIGEVGLAEPAEPVGEVLLPAGPAGLADAGQPGGALGRRSEHLGAAVDGVGGDVIRSGTRSNGFRRGLARRRCAAWQCQESRDG